MQLLYCNAFLICLNPWTDVFFSFSIAQTPKKHTRKILANPSTWKSNIAKKACQAGKEYTNRRGKQVQQKQVKTLKDCLQNCKFKCNQNISNEEREDILISFYSLPNATEKRHFILNTTSRSLTARPKRVDLKVPRGEEDDPDDVSAEDDSDRDENEVGSVKEVAQKKRKYSFRYFFHVKGVQVQVCQPFYLGTLDISKKPVYTAHMTKNIITNTVNPDLRGKNEHSRRKPTGDAQFAEEHIASFPTVEAHYCRAKTNRLYLGAHLSVGKMYDLYKEKCSDEDRVPVKKSMYQRIFVTKFNLGFHTPKTDRCDLCEMVKVAKQNGNLSEDLKIQYDQHIVLKTNMRNVRNKERENKDQPVLLFDMQNVILTPHAEISSLFYLRKLTVYNLTAYYSVTKKVYCAIWNETIGGRAGNDIASAFRKILDAVFEENNITDLITWSDSCVPQNRNSLISNAVMQFLKDNPDVNSITMQYSLPGHSCVQEVDNAHSQIEKAMKKTDFYSPIGLIRILRSINRYNPYRIIQMKSDDFKNFGQTAKLFNYKAVPFTQVSTLKFHQTLGIVFYKTSHDEYEPINMADIKFLETPKRNTRPDLKKKPGKVPQKQDSVPKKPVFKRKKCASLDKSVFDVKPAILKCDNEIPDLKKKDIKAAFPFMPLQDIEYYKTILHL
jgi:hypothetical protein